MILFLDIDGVLHPLAAHRDFREPGGGVYMHSDSLPDPHKRLELMCYAPQLLEILAQFPDVKIILASAWCWSLDRNIAMSVKYTKWLLPREITSRVVGAISDLDCVEGRDIGCSTASVLMRYVHRKKPSAWCALLSRHVGERVQFDSRVIVTSNLDGISNLEDAEDLRQRLQKGY